MHERDINKIVCRKHKSKRKLERARHRHEFNINIDLNESDECGLDSSGSEEGLVVYLSFFSLNDSYTLLSII
jgi:hypothetical protein